MSKVLEPLLTPQIKDYKLSRLCGRSQGEKSFACTDDGAFMTHDMTRQDSVGTFVLLLVCMSSCSASGWWMSSWCITASSPHGKVCGVFDGHLFAWCFIHTFLLSCMLVSLTGLSIRERCMFICPSVCEHIFAWSYICENIYFHASYVPLLVNLSFCMCSLCSSHSSLHHVCLCTYICSNSWRDNIISKNLLVYYDVWSFRMQVTRKGDKVVS